MFGDPATNPKGWPVVDGNTIFSQIRYGVGSPPPFSGNGVPFLRAGNIKRGQVIHHDLVFFEPIHATSISRSKVNEGDIVIVRRGAYTGECAAIPSEFGGAYVGYDLICVPSATTNPRWFSAAFNSTSIWQQIESIRKRAAQQGLNKNQILSFKLPYPPKDLQDKFAQEAASIQTQHGNMAVVKERLKALFHNLLHRAFSGDLTAKWREAHMTELLVEMEEQAKIIDAKGLT
jgi:type I restriction enzyme S subunit